MNTFLIILLVILIDILVEDITVKKFRYFIIRIGERICLVAAFCIVYE